MKPMSFDRFASLAAILAGVCAFVYSVAFIFLFLRGVNPGLGALLYSSAQVLGGLLATAALVAVYNRLRETDAAFAQWAFLLGAIGAIGSAIHGGYDLAVAVNPPASNPLAAANLPSEIDPRGLLTFGAAGVGLFFISWLMARGREFPKGLAYLGYLNALLLLVLYLGRLIILDPNSPVILVSALLGGFIVNPLWYIWLGLRLTKSQAPQ